MNPALNPYFDDGTSSAPWIRLLLFALSTGSAFLLYVLTLAPGLTWAHHGADGGELIAAAVVNGVPHPPGYPLYTLLLRGWLSLLGTALPWSELAWRGNLFSAFLAALSVGVTVLVANYLFRDQRLAWLWTAIAGIAWATSPLPWSQAVITEVYALHGLTVALLGWAVLVHGGKPLLLGPIVACGIANHLTFALLLPAVLYYCWAEARSSETANIRGCLLATMLGLVFGMALYLRIPLAASGGGAPPPVNWGYADNVRGLWWLVSGSAYRAYLFGGPLATMLGRLAVWANTLGAQLTLVGLGFGFWGLAYWDEHWPLGRTFSLLWVLPVSLYSVAYFTRDSEIYLLPVVWMLALWASTGVYAAAAWVGTKFDVRAAPAIIGGALLAGLLALATMRAQSIAVHDSGEAEAFLAEALAVIEPASIVITSADAPTFALWYGAWGSGELAEAAPDVVLVNHALYQFDWYGRLLGNLYPDVPGVKQSVEAVLAANADTRPVYFSDNLSFVPEEQLLPSGPLWRYQQPQEQP